jgi:AAA domain
MIDLMNEVSDVKTDKLFAIILGSSGAGKSHVAGTAPGKILYLYLDSERHGSSSALKSSGDLLAVCIDRDKAGNPLKPEAAFKRGLEILQPEVLKKAKIDTVVLDGLTELEKLVRATDKWKNLCQSAKGVHNSFAEGSSTITLADEYMRALRDAQDKAGVHVIVTGILDVQEVDDNGAIGVAKPRLSGYAVAEGLIQQFPDILVIGKVAGKDGKSGRVFQTNADVQRISKDQNGAVKKFINFEPRLAGAVALPAFIKADLKDVIALKTGVKA